MQLETSVTGSVSLEADRKGINMSRIMRSFYKHAETSFSFEVIGAVLDSYLSRPRQLRRAHHDALQLSDAEALAPERPGRLPVLQRRAGDGEDRRGDPAASCTSTTSIPRPAPARSSSSEHARRTRNQIATPHSQRSVARVSVELVGDGHALVRGSGRSLQRRDPDRDPGDGQARGRAGLRRAQRLEPDLRRGRGAPALRQRSRPTAASATSAWWPATRSRCTATTRCRS